MEYSKIVKKECPMCGKTYFVKLTEVEYDQYKKYGKCGRIPLTLINYVCEKNGWKYYNLEYDIDLNLD